MLKQRTLDYWIVAGIAVVAVASLAIGRVGDNRFADALASGDLDEAERWARYEPFLHDVTPLVIAAVLMLVLLGSSTELHP